jgi:hypothetical protein
MMGDKKERKKSTRWVEGWMDGRWMDMRVRLKPG